VSVRGGRIHSRETSFVRVHRESELTLGFVSFFFCFFFFLFFFLSNATILAQIRVAAVALVKLCFFFFLIKKNNIV